MFSLIDYERISQVRGVSPMVFYFPDRWTKTTHGYTRNLEGSEGIIVIVMNNHWTDNKSIFERQ